MMEASIGHNQPDMGETARDTAKDLSDWMKEHPIIQTEDEARESKVLIDRAKLCIKDLEDERKAKVAPLNEEVQAINEHYRSPRSLLQKVSEEISYRLSAFIRAEEDRRRKVADEAARAAAAAEAAARAAEAAETDALEASEHGELDVDVAGAVDNADRRFAEFQKAERQAAIAERDSKVKIGGGFNRAISARDRELLTVQDPALVLQAVGMNDYISEALLKSARLFKKLNGKYPPGIHVEIERSI